MNRRSVLMVGLCIYSVFSLISMAFMGSGAAVFLASLIYYFGGFGSLVRSARAEFAVPPVRSYLLVSLVLTLACVISLLVAWIHPLTYQGEFSRVHFFKDLAKAWYLFWPAFLVLGLKELTDPERETVLKSWLIGFSALSALGVFQHYFHGWPRPQEIPSNVGYFHTTLFLGHHLAVASVFIFPFFAAAELLLNSFRKGGGARRIGDPVVQTDPGRLSSLKAIFPRPFLFLAVALGLLALFFTYSRTLWIALPVGVFAWTLLILPRKMAIAFGLMSLLAGTILFQTPFVQQRIQDSYGVETRQHVWNVHYEFLKRRAWTGVGWNHNVDLFGIYNRVVETEKPTDGFYFVGHAHNNVIEMLAATGIFGALAWFLWCAWLFTSLWKVRRTQVFPSFPQGMFCAWIVFQINGLTQVNFWDSKVLHQMMLMVAWILFWRRSESRNA